MKYVDIIRHGAAEEDMGKGKLFSPNARVILDGKNQIKDYMENSLPYNS